jgi:GTP-binding protein EngB required for normal cell division
MIGNSQTGKSSFLETISKKKYWGLRGDGQHSETKFCKIYKI